MKNFKEKWNQFISLLKTNKKFLYFFISSIFLFSFVLVTGLGIKNRTDMNYEGVKLYQKQNISDRDLLITNAKYNPNSEMLRMDFYVESAKEMTSLTDKFTVEMVAKNNPKEKIKAQVIRVAPNYFVTYFKGIKNNFKVVKANINYIYTNTIINSDKTNLNLEFYMEDKDIKEDPTLKQNTNKSSLYESYKEVNIHLLNEKIKAKKQKIEKLKAKNQELNKQIKAISEELKYKIGSEKDDLLSQIDELNREININNTKINNAKKSISNQKERIKIEKTKKYTAK